MSFLQKGLVLFGMDLDGLATLKADGEVLDKLALIGQRLRGIDDALCHAALRGR